MDSFATHMFGDAAKAEQERAGIRERYEKVYQTRLTEGLGEDAVAFIESRTSFYMASVVENGWPYIQHRGGPAGFLKVFNAHTIGFADYTGNKQFITFGNLKTEDRVSLILMDYPRRARLKLIGHARMVRAEDNPDLAAQLSQDGEGPVERLVVVTLTAQDWNCPKYIEQRYNEAEIAEMLGPTIREKDQQIAALTAQLRALGEEPAI